MKIKERIEVFSQQQNTGITFGRANNLSVIFAKSRVMKEMLSPKNKQGRDQSALFCTLAFRGTNQWLQ